jgi:hypothetical protein
VVADYTRTGARKLARILSATLKKRSESSSTQLEPTEAAAALSALAGKQVDCDAPVSVHQSLDVPRASSPITTIPQPAHADLSVAQAAERAYLLVDDNVINLKVRQSASPCLFFIEYLLLIFFSIDPILIPKKDESSIQYRR